MFKKWKRLSSRYRLKSRWITIRQDRVKTPEGHVIPDYYVREGKDIVTVLAVTNEDKIILVRQYKYGADKVILELPTGFIDEKSPLAAARRELLEETGYKASHWRKLATVLTDPTSSAMKRHVYLAENARKVSEPVQFPNERTKAVLLSKTQFLAGLKKGTFKSQATYAAAALVIVRGGIF